jgi:uncharacterized protein
MRPAVHRGAAALRTAVIAVLLLPVHVWRATAVMRQPRCRYYPSCSTYAVEALRVHGPVRGSALAAGRVLRCHPWSLGGVDHVPPQRARRGAAQAGGPSERPEASAVHPSSRRAVEPSGVRDA